MACVQRVLIVGGGLSGMSARDLSAARGDQCGSHRPRSRLAAGTLLLRAVPPPDPSVIPTGGGILRPVLQRILAEETRTLGARVRLGVGIESLRDESSEVL